MDRDKRTAKTLPAASRAEKNNLQASILAMGKAAQQAGASRATAQATANLGATIKAAFEKRSANASQIEYNNRKIKAHYRHGKAQLALLGVYFAALAFGVWFFWNNTLGALFVFVGCNAVHDYTAKRARKIHEAQIAELETLYRLGSFETTRHETLNEQGPA